MNTAHRQDIDKEVNEGASSKPLPTILFILVSVGVLLFGIFLSWQAWTTTDNHHREQMRQRVVSIAQTLETPLLEHLHANESDYGSPHYQRLKEDLVRLGNAFDTYRFIYVLVRDDSGMIRIMVDNENPDSEDYSPPGDFFDEASDAIHALFAGEMTDLVIGPTTDRWGDWITALAKIPVDYSREGFESTLILGLDMDASLWQQRVWLVALPSLLLTLYILVIWALAFFFYHKRKKVSARAQPLLRRRELFLILALGLPISGYWGLVVWQRESNVAQIRFSELAKSQLSLLNSSLRRLIDVELESFGRYIETTTTLEESTIQYQANLLENNPSVLAWGWLPRVKQAEWEDLVRNSGQGEEDVGIWTRDAEGNRTSVPESEFYHPVLHFGIKEPRSVNLRGYVFGVDAVRKNALEQAYLTRLATSTEPLAYMPTLGGEMGVRICRAVFSHDDPDHLRGFVLIGVSFDKLLNAIPDSNTSDINLHFIDASGERIPLASTATAVSGKLPFQFESPLQLMGQVFVISVSPTKAWISDNVATANGWLTFLAGAITTFSVAAVICSLKKRSETLELLVQQRTEALSTSELRYRHLAENSPVGLFEYQLDAQGKHRLTYCSERFRQLMEISSTSANTSIGNLYAKIHAEDYNRVIDAVIQSRLKIASLHIEFRSLAEDDYRWLEVRSTPEKRQDGSIIWTGVCFDTTDRKNAEIAVSDRDRLLSAVAEGTRILLSEQEPTTAISAVLKIVGKAAMQDRAYYFKFIHDAEADEVFANQLSEWARPGVEPQIDNPELQRIPFKAIFPRWLEHFYAGAPVRGDVRTFPASERKILEPQAISSVLIFPVMVEGQLAGFVGFDHCDLVWHWNDAEEAILSTLATNIGAAIARHRREEELYSSRREAEAANQAKSLFLANMSHELRTPLNGIIGALELMRDSASLDEQRSYMDIIAKSGDHLLHLINDILDLAKIESGRMELVANPFSPKELLDELVGMIQTSAKEKNLLLSVACDDNVPEQVCADRQRILQILANLTSNAIKFTEHGFVSIECDWIVQNEQPGLRWAVTDSGIGIPAEKQELLFKKFSQIESSFSRRYGGTGLGLAISKELSQNMGGYIKVTSPHQSKSTAAKELKNGGPGATFTVWLPMAVAPSPASGKPIEDAPQATRKNIASQTAPTILLVEDNVVNQRVAIGLLKKLKLQVVVEDNAESALQRLKEERFDAILMDIQLPGMDGYELTQAIRNPHSKVLDREVPIIALTANALQSDREICLQVGMDDYMAKPIGSALLRQTLARHLPDWDS